jgi:hypothetical protein
MGEEEGEVLEEEDEDDEDDEEEEEGAKSKAEETEEEGLGSFSPRRPIFLCSKVSARLRREGVGAWLTVEEDEEKFEGEVALVGPNGESREEEVEEEEEEEVEEEDEERREVEGTEEAVGEVEACETETCMESGPLVDSGEREEEEEEEAEEEEEESVAM